jgi:hypothetical protein
VSSWCRVLIEVEPVFERSTTLVSKREKKKLKGKDRD